MSDLFNASASLLGYLFQCRFALLDAIRRLRCQGSFTVSIESLDDVTFEADGSPPELLQTKHHITRTAALTDASPDLWKPLRVWAEGLTKGRWSRDAIYYLVTTGLAQEGSAASYLRSDSLRNPIEARSRLNQVARTSANRNNQSAYTAYLALKESERLHMLERVVVCDGSPDIENVETCLREELAFAVKRGFVGPLVVRLEGWWLQRVIGHLRGVDDQRIASEDFDAELNRLRHQFRNDSLPIDDDLLDAEIDENAFGSHLFVEQLRLIDLNNRRIIAAMLRYFQASQQRSRWLREGFVVPGELSRYDKRLSEEWDIRFQAMLQELATEETEKSMRVAGRELYGWAEREVSVFIRSECYEPFVPRGSLQMLPEQPPGRC
jgi:hypothetical protein